MTEGSALLHAERDPVLWSRLRLSSLAVATALGIVEAGSLGAPAVLLGAVLLALADRWRKSRPIPSLLGVAVVAVATPAVALFLPVTVPTLFWGLGFRQGIAPVTTCFFLCFTSLIGHGVQPYGWAAMPLAVGYLLSLAVAKWISQIETISEEREHALADLRRSQQELATVSRRAGEAAERSRIAQEVHDGVTQRLVLIRMLLEAEKDRAGAERVSMAHEQALAGLAELRSLLASLREQVAPRSAHELRASIESFVASAAAGGEFTIDLSVDSYERLEALSAPVQITLLHLLRETLNNAAQHARARTVQVNLKMVDEGLSVIVEDDGVGSGPVREAHPGRGLGLPGLRRHVAEVGGALTLEDRASGGVRIHALLPVTD